MKMAIRTAILKYRLWFVVLLGFNVLYGLCLWLEDASGFRELAFLLLLGTAGIYIVTCFIIGKREFAKNRAISDFLEQPDNAELAAAAAGFCVGDEQAVLRYAGSILQEKDERLREQNLNMHEYQEYIEAWAHEIKMPLALMTFAMDNRRDECSNELYGKLEYARTRMQEDVERMLYYARMKNAGTDYQFTSVQLAEACREVLEEYAFLLQEQSIDVIDEMEDVTVTADRKGLAFCIRQIVSNAVKYIKPEADERLIRFMTGRDASSGDIFLAVRDNGRGVKAYDLPFIFDKGFTGDRGEANRSSTGMGLYLARQVAVQMNVRIEAMETCEEGFEIRLYFPKL